MNRHKLKQIICAGVLTASALNLTSPVFAVCDNRDYSKSDSTNLTTQINLLSEYDDEYEDEIEGYGTITVKHIDVDTKKEIADRDVYRDEPFGELTVTSRLNKPGYKLCSPYSQKVYLSASNPSVTVVFEYKSTTQSTVKPDTNPDSSDTNKPQAPSTGDTTQKPSTQSPSTQKPTTQEPSTQKPTTQKPSSNTTEKPITNDKQDNIESNISSGCVTIEYVDINSGKVFKTSKKDKLPLDKEYTYSGLEVDGYILHDTSSKSVRLSKENNNKTIVFRYSKIESKSKLSRAILKDMYDNDDVFSTYHNDGSINISKSLMKAFLDSNEKELELSLENNVSDLASLEQQCLSKNATVVTAFTISTNLNNIESDSNITINKKVGSKYNNKKVYLYKILDDKNFEYVDESTVSNGEVSFDAVLSSSEYFVSDVKVYDNVDAVVDVSIEDVDGNKNKSAIDSEINYNTESTKDNLSFPIAYVVAGLAVVFGGILGTVKLLKNKNKNNKID